MNEDWGEGGGNELEESIYQLITRYWLIILSGWDIILFF